MRAIDPALQAHLDSGATTLCTCWRLIRADGIVLGFTDHDRVLGFDGTTFTPESGATGMALEATAGLAADNSVLAGAFDTEAISDADLMAGRYDGATIELWRVNWQAPAQRLLLQAGTLGEATRQDGHWQVEMRGPAHRLGATIGRVYQHRCDARLGDQRCGIDPADPAWQGTGTVTAVAGRDLTVSGLDAFAGGWFSHGLVTVTSGAAAGLSRAIDVHRSAGAGLVQLVLWQALPGLADGDLVQVTAGCDKRWESCREKFANATNFRGFPHMPGNDFVLRVPVPGENNDGGKRP